MILKVNWLYEQISKKSSVFPSGHTLHPQSRLSMGSVLMRITLVFRIMLLFLPMTGYRQPSATSLFTCKDVLFEFQFFLNGTKIFYSLLPRKVNIVNNCSVRYYFVFLMNRITLVFLELIVTFHVRNQLRSKSRFCLRCMLR